MNLSFSSILCQTQKVIITQELRQSIEILELSNIELIKLVENEWITKPVLEINIITVI